ncbi:hypothetical protein DDN52_06670 [Vibrio cholerae]|nr:hypothetical protein [Vibrio cholerae]
MMSGSSDALLRHRPLRTVRASFPAYGSSLYEPALTYEPATTNPLPISYSYGIHNRNHHLKHL